MTRIDSSPSSAPIAPAAPPAPVARAATPVADAAALVTARLLSTPGVAAYTLELGGVQVQLRGEAPLPAGSTLTMQLSHGPEGTRLTPVLTADERPWPEAVTQALRQLLPRSESLAALLPALRTATLPPALALAGSLTANPQSATPQLPASAPALTGANSAAGVAVSAAGVAALDTLVLPQAAAGKPDAKLLTRTAGTPAAPNQALTGLEDETLALARTGATAPQSQPASPSTPAPPPLLPLPPATAGAGASLATTTTQAPLVSTSAVAALATTATDPGVRGDGAAGDSGAGASLDARRGAVGPAASGDALPGSVTAALAELAKQVPDLQTLRQPAGVATALQRSGLMLEAHLAEASPTALAHVEGDLKAALLRVKDAVVAERGPESSPLAVLPEKADATALAVDARASAHLRALGDTLDGALARIAVNQLQLSQVDTGPVAFSVELPMRQADGDYRPVELDFEREAPGEAGEAPLTTVVLRMQPPELGLMTAVLRLRGEHLSTELWAEQPATRALLYNESDRLAAQLRGAGLDASGITIGREPPPRRAPLSRGLIDTRI